MHHLYIAQHSFGRVANVAQELVSDQTVWVNQNRDLLRIWQEFVSQSQLFRPDVLEQSAHTRYIAGRPVQIFREPVFNGVAAHEEDGNRGGLRLRRERRGWASKCRD